MKNVKTLRFKPLVYLFLSAVVLSFSAFSCEGCDEDYAPLEIQIENKTGYDLTNINIDDIHIESLKKDETSGYIQTEDFEYLQSIFATVKGKFERELRSISTIPWCGNDSYYDTKHHKNALQSGKYDFSISIYEEDGVEYLHFSKK
ncbi:hypothetical protein [Bernardetia sp.]|uniref:hypothetical protein n=1 Tax=Bernardetia sp. TaxID=1937974 RepID=UPI0025C1CC54|nr:hypothetical protein [Bernardetia sp.]